jgi:hypothetical protein
MVRAIVESEYFVPLFFSLSSVLLISLAILIADFGSRVSANIKGASHD